VIVLGLVAITLGLSYTLLRSQSFDFQSQRNQSRVTEARAAAQAGMAIALRKLHDGSWSGADTSFTGNLDTSGLQGFVVTYTTGDSRLTESSPDWSEYPFRLTIVSKGYAIDPLTSSSRSDYTVQTVVQLVRKRRSSSTVARSGLEAFSIFQTGNDDATIHYPVRINGNAHVQGEIDFSQSYPRPYYGSEYFQFWDDLRRMYDDRGWDYRPFGGHIYTPTSRQPWYSDFWKVLDSRLRVPWTNVSTSSTPAVPMPSSFASYRLYAKGKAYAVKSLAVQPDASDAYPSADYVLPSGSYGPDMTSNPLGVFTFAQDRVAIGSATTVQGMVLSRLSTSYSDMVIAGNQITLSGTALPPLQGETGTCRLPAVMSRDSIRVFDGQTRQVNGWLVCGDDFRLEPGSSQSTLTVNGGVFSKRLYLHERTAWIQSSSAWDDAMDSWNVSAKTGLNQYFPGWLSNFRRDQWGFYLTPRLIFNPTPTGDTNHVPDWSQPLYVPHPDDGGALLWDVVSWTEPGAG
jgi:hypothetical protein